MSTSNNCSKTGKNFAVSVDICCSLSCLKPKKLLSAIFHPKSRSLSKSHHPRSNSSPFLSRSFSSSTSAHNNFAASPSFSPPSPPGSDHNLNSLQYMLESEADGDSKAVKGFGRIDGEGIAVEKDSRDPYLDFQHSMLQMIIENDIYSRDDLGELLGCFLQLNSPCYHGVIVHAFTEIYNGVSSVTSSHPFPNDAHYGCPPSFGDY